ncbi:MAG: host attachment protein [Bdellovibrionaceae bacterium]|nr:host attachment protein [Bdellovibrionales bacterium]MCB9255425.1 host attachment protein [Pseudobdellovibrionaceae bacterium]
MAGQKDNVIPIQGYHKNRWIVVGDASRFIVYEKHVHRDLHELGRFPNPAAHEKISAIASDQPGRGFSRNRQQKAAGVPRHAYSSEQDPKSHALETVVKTVGEFLNTACAQHKFDEFVLVMDGRLSGILRTNLRKSTLQSLVGSVEKDLAWLEGTDLKSRIEAVIESN